MTPVFRSGGIFVAADPARVEVGDADRGGAVLGCDG